jgi:hypothetical protein
MMAIQLVLLSGSEIFLPEIYNSLFPLFTVTAGEMQVEILTVAI